MLIPSLLLELTKAKDGFEDIKFLPRPDISAELLPARFRARWIT
jgi:hypothetical protein